MLLDSINLEPVYPSFASGLLKQTEDLPIHEQEHAINAWIHAYSLGCSSPIAMLGYLPSYFWLPVVTDPVICKVSCLLQTESLELERTLRAHLLQFPNSPS